MLQNTFMLETKKNSCIWAHKEFGVSCATGQLVMYFDFCKRETYWRRPMKKIRNKILLLLLTTTSFFILLVGAYSLFTMYQMNIRQADSIDQTLKGDYDNMIKSEVETAVTIVDFYFMYYQEGKMDEVTAKETAIAAIKTLVYHDEGYFWIDDTDGNLIAHPIQPENEGNNRIDLQDPNGVYLIKEIIKAAKDNNNNGFTDYMWVKPEDTDTNKLSPKRAYSKLFEPWNWVVSTGNYIDDIDATVQIKEAQLEQEFQTNALRVIGFLVLSLLGNTLLGILLSRIISRPIISLMKAFEKDKEGKITIQEIHIKSKDEIGQLAWTLNEMSRQVKGFIKGVLKESGDVLDSSNIVKQDIVMLNDRIEEISSTTEEIAAGMEETTAISDDLSSKAEDISDSAIDIAKQADEAAKAVMEISERAEHLKVNFNTAVNSGNKFITNANNSLGKALEDSKAVAQISELADAIIEITEQTNLLALNASIEAAHAGEAGKGFAIIAEEIRLLADNSQKTVNQIQNMIQSVTSAVDSLYGNSKELVSYMMQNVKSDYELMLHASDEYSTDAKKLSGIISDFRVKANKLSLIIQDMTKAMNEIATATGEGADGASDIANSIDSVTEKMNELLLEANKSEDNSTYLLELVSQFNI